MLDDMNQFTEVYNFPKLHKITFIAHKIQQDHILKVSFETSNLATNSIDILQTESLIMLNNDKINLSVISYKIIIHGNSLSRL